MSRGPVEGVGDVFYHPDMAAHRIETLVRRAVDTATVDEVDGKREVRFAPEALAQLTKELRSAGSINDAVVAAWDEISRILGEADISRTETDPEYKKVVLDRALAGIQLKEVVERQPTRRRFVDGPEGLRPVDE